MGQVTLVGVGTADGKTGGADPQPICPDNILADDMILVGASASVNTTFATNAISGFTRKVTNNSGGSSPVLGLYYKRAAGSESLQTLTVNSPGGGCGAGVLVFRNIDWAQPFGLGTAADQLGGSSAAVASYGVPTQTPEIAGCAAVLLAVANVASGSFTPNPTGYTKDLDSTFTATVDDTAMYHRLNLAVSATGIRTITRNSGTTRGSVLGVIIRPAPDDTFEGWGLSI